MKKDVSTYQSAHTPYYIHGKHPRYLIISGTHGDEYGVIAPVQQALEGAHDELGDFVYIPQVSPSAVAQKTRHNADGVDLNRHFIDDPVYDEVIAVQQILTKYHFETCFSFHEDPEHSGFYMYDSNALENDALAHIRACLTKEDIPLFTGVDDPHDEVLGLEITEGYRGNVDPTKHTGPLESWLVTEGIADRVFGFEIPGSADQSVKDTIVKHLFSCFITCERKRET